MFFALVFLAALAADELRRSLRPRADGGQMIGARNRLGED